jgi:argininosuccinate synthase
VYLGRIDIVENRFIGIKSRGCYETPGGTILRAAHVDLEGLTLDREVRRLKNEMSQKLSEILYNGFWFSAEREFIMSAVESSQKFVTGSVHCNQFFFRARKTKKLTFIDVNNSEIIQGQCYY